MTYRQSRIFLTEKGEAIFGHNIAFVLSCCLVHTLSQSFITNSQLFDNLKVRESMRSHLKKQIRVEELL